MRARLRLPTRLAVTVLASAACSSPTTQTDASADVVSTDNAVLDVIRDVISRDVFDAGRVCTRNPFDPENPAPAVRCLARRGEAMACPGASVCVAEDCPAHCEGCVSPLFCIPDPEADAGVACVVSTVCSADACNPGCRAVG